MSNKLPVTQHRGIDVMLWKTTARRFDGIWRPTWTLAAWVTQRGGSAEESIAGDQGNKGHMVDVWGVTVIQEMNCLQLRPPEAIKAHSHDGEV